MYEEYLIFLSFRERLQIYYSIPQTRKLILSISRKSQKNNLLGKKDHKLNANRYTSLCVSRCVRSTYNW